MILRLNQKLPPESEIMCEIRLELCKQNGDWCGRKKL